MSNLISFEAFIRDKIEKERWTHERLSVELLKYFPGRKGLSVRSLKRFCCAHGIHKTNRLDSADLDGVVTDAIDKVGPTYGRKTITGLLASQGIRISERRIGESLRRVNPGYNYQRRTATARQVNPRRYYADYFGHKLHVDQSEKLAMFGCTHVCAIDGFSSKIVGFITLAVKNSYVIYCDLFQPILSEYGIWDQIRVDQGKEWVLMLFIQEELSHLRRNTSRDPHLQSTSKQNHCIERMWVEINGRVNYPIKTVLVQMEQNNEFDLNCDHVKYCVSWFTQHVAHVGTTMFVKAWNDHRIPGRHRGIPNILMDSNNQVAPVNPNYIPNPNQALQEFRSHGGHITTFNRFGCDPLGERPDLMRQREETFFQQYPEFDPIFHTIVNGDYSLFRSGILCIIDVSKHLEALL